MKVKVVLESNEDGSVTAYVPSLPGCMSDGDTEEEALSKIKHEIEQWVEPTAEELVVSDKAKVVEVII
jgi:predicted RNase H-like HicB family nuclease